MATDRNGIELHIGDYIKGTNYSTYGITNEHMLLGRVEDIRTRNFENIFVRIIAHQTSPQETGVVFWVDSDKFEKVEISEQEINEMLKNLEIERMLREDIEKPRRNYGYKPSPIFYGDKEDSKYNTIYMGMELETEKISYDSISEENETITKCLQMFNKTQRFLYCKTDGSLYGYGAEFVTHPFTLKYFKDNLQDSFKSMLELLKNSDYQSHNGGHCGLHIHISKNAFGNNDDEINKNVNKLILFTEFYNKSLIPFSRRKEDNMGYCKLLSKSLGYRFKDLELKKFNTEYINKKKYSSGRHVAVNVENSNTIEIRIFRGTLEFETLVATLEFVDNLVRVIREYKTNNISWNKVIKYGKTEYLKGYCVKREIPTNGNYMHDYARQLNAMIEKAKTRNVELAQIIKDMIIRLNEKVLDTKVELPTNRDRNELYKNIQKLNNIYELWGYMNRGIRENDVAYLGKLISDILEDKEDAEIKENIIKLKEDLNEYNKNSEELRDLQD